MAFLHPGFLWALLALAIPIIIHLFQLRRYKKILFPNVQFLQEVEQQTRSRSKLQHLLVLFSRLLALSFLVFAFAQPFLPGKDGAAAAGEKAVSVYLDDSFSMDALNNEGRALDVARKAAQDAALTFGATDRFQVLTSRLEGRQQQLMGRDEAVEAIAQVEVGPFERPLSKVMARQREALSKSDAAGKRAFLFTDLQRGMVDIDQWKNDSTMSVVIVPVQGTDQANLYIDSVWFTTPVRRLQQTEEVHVQVKYTGDQELRDISMRLFLNGKQRGLSTFSIDPKGTSESILRYKNPSAGIQQAMVQIDDHPVVFDDKFYFSYSVANKTRVLLIGGADARTDGAIGNVFDGDSLHSFSTADHRAIDVSRLPEQDVVILNALPDPASGLRSALKEFVDAGGSLAIFPSEKNSRQTLNQLLGDMTCGQARSFDTTNTRINRIDLEHPFFSDVFDQLPRNVDLPVVSAHFPIQRDPRMDVLLQLQDGSPFLSLCDLGQGRVLVCASPLATSNGNFIQHALFVTSLLRLAETSKPTGAIQHTIGGGGVIPLNERPPGDAVVHMVGANNVDLVPEMRRTGQLAGIALHAEDLEAGPYFITLNDDTLQGIALNYPRSGSDLSVWEPAALQAELDQRGLTNYQVLYKPAEELSVSLAGLDKGTPLWKWCIALALLFLGIEVLLIRFLR